MKRRFFALILVLATLLCVPAAAAEDGAAEITVSTDMTDLDLSNNVGANYVRGNGMGHSPAESFLYANEKGGVTLVQYTGKNTGVAVAEYDANLDFLNVRYLPVEGIAKWAGFCAGETYNYIAYAVPVYYTRDALKVDQYDKQWNLVNSVTVTFSNTGSIISNDFDMVEANGYLHIITNHTMTDGTAKGHQANMHAALSVASLTPMLEHTGVSNYAGYTSHSYVPDIVASGSKIYTFDRSDTYPGAGLYQTTFQSGFYSGSMSHVRSMAFNDWGSLGNATAGPNDSALAAFAYAPGRDDNTSTNIYLYHTASGTKQVSYGGGAGTPYVAAASGTVGYVVWNPDRYMSGVAMDDLYYAVYVVNGSSMAVGAVLKAEGHYLSDCEPITFDGGVLWYTVEYGEVVFHHLKVNSAPTKKTLHVFEAVEGQEPTCAEPGYTAGTRCVNCDAVGEGLEEIPAVPHTEVVLPARDATCSEVGRTEGKGCSVCGAVIVPQEEIPTIAHTEVTLGGREPTCYSYGLTEGKRCTVCGQTTVWQEYIDRLPHAEVPRPGYAPTCTAEGRTDGIKCEVCNLVLDNGEAIPKVEHTIVDTPEVPPTVGQDGKTAGTGCSVCNEQFTGGEVIPKTLFEITEQKVKDGKLTLIFDRNKNYTIIFTLWDGEGNMLAVKMASRSDYSWWANTIITFDLPAGAVYYRAFALQPSGSVFAPVCDVREGLIEYPT